MKLIEKFLIRTLHERLCSGESITQAKVKMTIYEMIRERELSDDCLYSLEKLTKHWKEVGHLNLSEAVRKAPKELVRRAKEN